MPERYFYLGLVEAKYRIRNDTPVARVHPLYEEDIDDDLDDDDKFYYDRCQKYYEYIKNYAQY